MKIEKTELKVFRQAVKCSTCDATLEVIQDFDAHYEYGADGTEVVPTITYNCRCLNCGTVEKMKSKDYPGGIVYEDVTKPPVKG